MKANNLVRHRARQMISCALLTGSLLVMIVNAEIYVKSSTDAAQTFSISGKVTDGHGNPLGSWKVTLGGTRSGTTTTDSMGNYSFPNLDSGGNYNVGPASGGQNTLVGGVDVNN